MAASEGPQPEGRPCCGRRRFIRNSHDKAVDARFPLGQAFTCARCGIAHAFRTQRNMKIHSAIAVLAVVLAAVLRLDAPSWCAIILCITVVMAAECFNTALEAVVDLVTDDYHDLARVAKDCAAGAMYVCAVGSVAVAAAVFLPPLAALVAAAL